MHNQARDIAACLGLDEATVRKLQARGYLQSFQLSETEARERLYQAHRRYLRRGRGLVAAPMAESRHVRLRKGGIMSRTLLGWTLAAAASVSLLAAAAAGAYDRPWTWTTTRAERLVTAQVPMYLPPAERASLAADLRRQKAAYLLAAMAAYEVGDWLALGMYNNVVSQLVRALDKIELGLGVDAVRCTGIGRAVSRRYKHFRCAANSGVIEIPTVASIELVNDREIVTQGPPRLVGPLTATFEIHVRGTSKLTYRKVGP